MAEGICQGGHLATTTKALRRARSAFRLHCSATSLTFGSMLKRLTHGLLLFALIFAMGGQWAVLQSIAWSKMLATNLRSGSIRLAIDRTFDGKHPCCLCKAVQAGKSSEEKREFTPVRLKLEFTPFGEMLALAANSTSVLFPPEQFSAECLVQEPATPPPRSFFA